MSLDQPITHQVWYIIGIAVVLLALLLLIGSLMAQRRRREHAEGLLRESEQRLNRSQEIAHLGSWELDLSSNALSWSDEVYRIFGLEPQEFGATYEAFLEHVHPDDRDAVNEAYSSSIAEGRDSYEIEHRVVRKGGGEIRFVHEKCQHMRDGDGRIVRSVGMVLDITERRHTEDALRQSEAKYRRLFENMVEEVHFWEVVRNEDSTIKTWRLVDANPPALKTWGRSTVEEIRGKTTDEIFGPGATDHYLAVVRKLMTEGTPYVFEDYFPQLDKYFRFTSVPLADHFITTGADISDIKKAELALRKTSDELGRRTRELDAILSSVQDYLYILDPEGRFLFANKKLLELWGMSGDQAMGRNMRELHYPADVEATLLAGIRHVYRTGEIVTSETYYTSAAGTLGYYENILAPMYDADGHITGIAGSSRDVTDRKQSEEKAKRFSQFPAENPNPVLRCSLEGDLLYTNEPARLWLATFGWQEGATLPEQVRKAVAMAGLHDYAVELDITNPSGRIFDVFAIQPPGEAYINLYGIDITERELARESLERSNRDLEQFAYVASHDLQEPLRAIVGFLQLLESRYEDQVDEKGRHYIERSVKAAHRMQKLIRDLLTLSRVRAKGSTLAPTDLNQVVLKVLDNLHETVQERNAEVHCGLLPVVNIDAGQIGSLLQNLLVNALRYNQSPRPRIDIDFQELDDTYRFRVQDNGIGIPPQFSQRIFLVFQRLHTEREYPGTGLGLALCKRIIERHGGTLWVEPNPTGGSIFYFTLPKEPFAK